MGVFLSLMSMSFDSSVCNASLTCTHLCLMNMCSLMIMCNVVFDTSRLQSVCYLCPSCTVDWEIFVVKKYSSIAHGSILEFNEHEF